MYVYVYGVGVMYMVIGIELGQLSLPIGARLFKVTLGSRQLDQGWASIRSFLHGSICWFRYRFRMSAGWTEHAVASQGSVFRF